MSTSQGNIFLTTENLAFSLPLIAVCGIYAYFHFIPLKYGVPALVGAFVVYQIRNQIHAQHARKLQNMDQKELDELALKLEEEEDNNGNDGKEDAETKKLKKKKYLVEQRLAAERRKAAKANKKTSNDDDDDDDDLGDITTFAKGSRPTKKKK